MYIYKDQTEFLSHPMSSLVLLTVNVNANVAANAIINSVNVGILKVTAPASRAVCKQTKHFGDAVT